MFKYNVFTNNLDIVDGAGGGGFIGTPEYIPYASTPLGELADSGAFWDSTGSFLGINGDVRAIDSGSGRYISFEPTPGNQQIKTSGGGFNITASNGLTRYTTPGTESLIAIDPASQISNEGIILRSSGPSIFMGGKLGIGALVPEAQLDVGKTFDDSSDATERNVFGIDYEINFQGAQTGVINGIHIAATETNLFGASHDLFYASIDGDVTFRIDNSGALYIHDPSQPLTEYTKIYTDPNGSPTIKGTSGAIVLDSIIMASNFQGIYVNNSYLIVGGDGPADGWKIKGDSNGESYLEPHSTSTSYRIEPATKTTDSIPGDFKIKAQSALTSATTNIAGSDHYIEAGDGASGSSGAANGGDVYISGGTGYGTGIDGKVIANILDPQVEKQTSTISPTLLSANTDNWNPTGLSGTRVIRIGTTGGNVELRGIVAQADQIITLVSVTGGDIKITNESATSTASNRFALQNDTTFKNGQAVTIWHDATTDRWRLISFSV